MMRPIKPSGRLPLTKSKINPPAPANKSKTENEIYPKIGLTFDESTPKTQQYNII